MEKALVKGYNFFKSGKVLGLYSKSENGLVSVFLNIGCTTTYKFDKFWNLFDWFSSETHTQRMHAIVLVLTVCFLNVSLEIVSLFFFFNSKLHHANTSHFALYPDRKGYRGIIFFRETNNMSAVQSSTHRVEDVEIDGTFLALCHHNIVVYEPACIGWNLQDTKIL